MAKKNRKEDANRAKLEQNSLWYEKLKKRIAYHTEKLAIFNTTRRMPRG